MSRRADLRKSLAKELSKLLSHTYTSDYTTDELEQLCDIVRPVYTRAKAAEKKADTGWCWAQDVP